jgi:TrmH family RNA methyltransferase
VITSKQNAQIKSARALLSSSKSRAENKSFVIEGLRLAEAAIDAQWPIISGIYSEEIGKRGGILIERLNKADIDMNVCTPEIIKYASDTQNPQGLILVVSKRKVAFPAKAKFILILDALQDPGNMGSLLRSALGAGVDGILLGPKCVDAYSPKVLRSGMGAQFHLPIEKMNWDEIGKLLSRQPLKVFVSDVDKGSAHSEAAFEGPTALILGNEAEGVGVQARALAQDFIQIPMSAQLESLNVAAAGAILMFEIARQQSMGDAQ